YLDFLAMFPEVHFRHRIGINWSAPEIAIKVAFKAIVSPSCWIDRFWGNFHVTAVANTSEHWYNRRLSVPQTWDGNTQMGTNLNLGHQSIMAGDRIPHVAGIAATFKVDHWEDQPPVTNQQNLSAATSTYANMIAPPDVGGALAIVFSNVAHFLGLLYRPPLMPWLPEASPAGTDVIELACHYAYPDVISCLWERPGAMATSFYAFWAPWH
ncbi:unnamed protein product, partial [marine sediment metagenome]